MDEVRFLVFEESIYDEGDEFLNQLEQCALVDGVPIIRKDTQGFLKFMLRSLNPQRILEIGTAVGFSAILMAKYSDADIITIENYEKRIPIAKANFKACGYENRITLVEGDAQKRIPELSGSFDLVFIDAAKGQYQTYFNQVFPLLHEKSVVICDNVLFDGDVLESRFAVERRDRTIHKRMRDFLYDACHDKRFTSSVLPVGDGLLLSVVNGKKQ